MSRNFWNHTTSNELKYRLPRFSKCFFHPSYRFHCGQPGNKLRYCWFRGFCVAVEHVAAKSAMSWSWRRWNERGCGWQHRAMSSSLVTAAVGVSQDWRDVDVDRDTARVLRLGILHVTFSLFRRPGRLNPAAPWGNGIIFPKIPL